MATPISRSEFNRQFLAISGGKRVKPQPISELTSHYYRMGEVMRWVIARDDHGDVIARADRGIKESIYGLEWSRQTARIDGLKELEIRKLAGKAALDYLYRVYLVWCETETTGEIAHWINQNRVN